MNEEFSLPGGYDRGECLNNTDLYDVESNSWTPLEPMLTKRGRFDITVVGDVIYAVAGSNGHAEQPTCEMYDSATGKWSFIASLPVPVSNIGELQVPGYNIDIHRVGSVQKLSLNSPPPSCHTRLGASSRKDSISRPC